MAHLWVMSNESDWQPYLLPGDGVAVGPAGTLQPAPPAGGVAELGQFVLLRRAAAMGEDTWVLLAESGAAVLVNGLPATGGIVVLTDRDELRRPASAPMFFSTERLAATEPYPGHVSRAFCPRCKQAIGAGEPAVRCPGCGLWHHGTEQLPCWTYGEHCAACSQPTSVDAEFQWTPEEV